MPAKPFSTAARRMIKRFLLQIGMLLLAASAPMSVAGTQASTVREERTVIVNGVKEVWQLVWIGKITPVCGAETLDDIEVAHTCPCAGATYGETGHLWLVRKRNGREIERMALDPLFATDVDNPGTDGRAYLQRRAAREGDLDQALNGDKGVIERIRQRPVVSLIKFGDYNHDGRATEFLLQVGTLPCEKRVFTAVGVSADNPGLHAFTSAEEPEKPLVTFLGPWQALLRSSKPMRMTVWPCGDHGSEVQSDVTVSVRDGRIHHVMEDRDCAGE